MFSDLQIRVLLRFTVYSVNKQLLDDTKLIHTDKLLCIRKHISEIGREHFSI